MKIRKDDNVMVITGKDKGKTGKVVRALPRENKVLITGINVVKIHTRPKKAGQKGQVIDKSMPINISNVMVIDPEKNKPTRISIKRSGGKKERIAKKSGRTL